MRIIGGKARSIPLAVPPDMAIRPTADRAREALFNSLGSIENLVVWDLYAGCGALGLECASRGAKFIGFVEKELSHCDWIEKNIAKVRTAVPAAATNLVNSSVQDMPFPTPRPDLIFADPPYANSFREFKALLAKPQFRDWAKKAQIVWEIPDAPNGILGEFLLASPRQRAVRRFGGTEFLIINSLEQEDE